jgi:glycosyltransferase involved in cell wall biosynthesis
LFYPDYSKRVKVFTIVFSGRLVEQKDPMTFLKAIQLLSQQKINFKAEIFGDGALRNKMENFVACNQLQEMVEFKGWLKKEELADAYRKSHVFVSTSLEEGMSVAILEAMASGLYAFATPVSNNVTIITDYHSGEIFNCGDPKTLAQKLLNFYENKFLQEYQIPNNILEEFGDFFHNKVIVEAYHELAIRLSHIKNNTFQE